MKTQIVSILVLVGLLAITSCQKKPMACFEANPTTISAGQSVNFSSACSEDAHHYEWDFGDGGTSSDANPTHTYNTTGLYTVRLKTMSMNSKKLDEISKTITVN